VERRLQLLTV